MKLKEIVSCYVSKTYVCDKKTFAEVVALFHDCVNTFDDDFEADEAYWRRSTKSDDKVVFKKGASVAPTFDYSGPKGEVRVIFKYDSDEQQFKLSVGNSGFPFESLLSKSRYIDLLDNIHNFVVKSGKVKESVA